ncbi:MAG: 2-C-methyl-D-erythritol 2,4-cyclodiphosphate synthase [Firmicutes bacterium ADurb.Bin248]|nr:MAG: 2-C-methyl-D-erythritol 2,4-cyclodiphosphate synthase [Firmicutes bacterium ADurb.Bin248]HOG00573.1 2-C-methyl-D-erythritol 2,4-cyclodiphosphate synthase [Clostridia bacterium]HPK14764.1 2-C-methyl-D-erythritol 2,4-cyclodiphosphate synthase [Clostridia bacterium]
MDKVYAVLLAGGASARMGRDKLTLALNGKTPLARALEALLCCGNKPEHVVIAASEGCMEEAARLAKAHERVSVAPGGKNRGESALNGLRALGAREGVVAIHDAARCLVPAQVIDAAIESARTFGCGVAAIPVRDTLREASGACAPRDGLFAVQTPQAFDLEKIRAAYEKAGAGGESHTDDLGVWLAAGHEARYTLGDLTNQKLTYPGDMAFFAAVSRGETRVGEGWDTHRLAEGRRLVLGGVDIPFGKGLLGHSDADALAHAVIDALLGAAALGDIGRHFPDTDESYAGISSMELLSRAAKLVCEAGYTVGNVDATVVAQRPKLAPHIDKMRENLAEAMGCAASRVSVKAKTAEGLNAEGEGMCISARACALLKN